MYGVYSDYESDTSSFYNLTIGVSQENDTTDLNEVTIKSGDYLVFRDSGPMPDTVINLWKQIWGYFDDGANHQRNFISDFEVYNGVNQIAIYIGIK